MGWHAVTERGDAELTLAVREELRRMLLAPRVTYVFGTVLCGVLFCALLRPYVPWGRLLAWEAMVLVALVVIGLALVPPLAGIDDRYGVPVLLPWGAWASGVAFGLLPWFVGLDGQPGEVRWLCVVCLLGVSVGVLTGSMSATLHGLRVEIGLWGVAAPAFAMAHEWVLVGSEAALLWFVVSDGLQTRRIIVEGVVARIEATRAAVRDPLTGLANRAGVMAALDLLTAARPDGRRTIGVLYVDLDHFKAVNDSHGHLVGDEVLRGTAGRLRAACRAGDVVARLGGDEFLVVLPGTDGSDGSDDADLAARIVAELERPFTVDGLCLRVSASVGVARAPAGEAGTDELVRRADEALYAAKRAGRGRAVLAG